jgi:hypothetical protein
MSPGRDRKYGLGSEFSRDATQQEVEGSMADNLYSYEVGAPNLTEDFWKNYRQQSN